MKHMPAIQIGDHDAELPTYEALHPVIEQNRRQFVGDCAVGSNTVGSNTVGSNVVRLADEDQIRIAARHPTEDAFDAPGYGMYAAIHAAASDRQATAAPQPAPETPKGGLDIYIAGPMTGIPNFNFPAFYAAQEYLERQGHRVFNPAERDKIRHGRIDISIGNDTGDPAQAVRDHGFSLRDALRDDTHYICTTATAIAMLPGWESSKGACAEHKLAHALGLLILYL